MVKCLLYASLLLAAINKFMRFRGKVKLESLTNNSVHSIPQKEIISLDTSQTEEKRAPF